MPNIAREIRVWFDLPNDPVGGRVELRHIKDGEAQQILSKITVTQTSLRDGRQEVIARQTDNPNMALAAAAIVGWEHHYDEQGQPLACTRENIERFLREDDYLRIITGLISDLTRETKRRHEDAEKN